MAPSKNVPIITPTKILPHGERLWCGGGARAANTRLDEQAQHISKHERAGNTDWVAR